MIRKCHTVLSAVFRTAFNDQITGLNPCSGIRLPPIARKLRTILTPGQFDQLYAALPTEPARLLAELFIESGLRWSELIELRSADLNPATRALTISRTAVELVARFHPTGGHFLVKGYPKDREHRRVRLGSPIVGQLQAHIVARQVGRDDLIFTQDMLLPPPELPRRLQLVTELLDLGRTEPNAAGRRYRHGSLAGYNPGGCKCEHCRGAFAVYRAERRALGKDNPRAPRTITTDGHIPGHGSASGSGSRRSTPQASASGAAPTTSAMPTLHGC